MAENNGAAPAAPAAAPSAEGPSVRDFLDFDPFEPADAGQEGTGEARPAPADEPVASAEGDALPPSGGQAPSQQQPQQSGQRPDDPVLRELARINETLAASQQPQQQYTPPQAQAPGPRFNLEI